MTFEKSQQNEIKLVTTLAEQLSLPSRHPFLYPSHPRLPRLRPIKAMFPVSWRPHLVVGPKRNSSPAGPWKYSQRVAMTAVPLAMKRTKIPESMFHQQQNKYILIFIIDKKP